MRTIVLRKARSNTWTLETVEGHFLSSRRWVYRIDAEQWAHAVLRDMLTSYSLKVIDDTQPKPEPPETPST